MLSLNWADLHDQKKIVMLLKNNDLLVGTSDTVWGLYAQTTEQAFLKLNAIKKRENNKPYLILVADTAHLALFVSHDDIDRVSSLMRSCWPGPLTLIMRAKQNLPSYMMGPRNSIAVRVPAHPFLRAVLMQVPGLFSTSANLAGDPVPAQTQDINPLILDQVAALVSDSPQSPSLSEPSTILDCTYDPIRVVRRGAFSVEKLEKICGVSFD
jgi:L-threonylcarbamoyladenylate synthase